MAYDVELSESAERELGKLDPPQAKRILKFRYQRVAKLIPLTQYGIRTSGVGWKFQSL